MLTDLACRVVRQVDGNGARPASDSLFRVVPLCPPVGTWSLGVSPREVMRAGLLVSVLTAVCMGLGYWWHRRRRQAS
ncbi:MAG: hypothetical protein U1D30_14115 [Planctomycetota bacterium]